MKKRKKNKKINKIIPNTTSEKVLLISFILMLILVIVLTFVAINKKKEYKEKQDSMTVAITEKETNNSLNVDISNLEENALTDYKFKITNYRDNKINNSVKKYSIIIDNNENDVTLKLYKNSSEDNLLKDKTDYKIDGLTLKKKTKQIDDYTLIIKSNKKTGSHDFMTIKVVNTN